MAMVVIYSLTGKKTYNFEAYNKILNFPIQFCLGSIYEKSDYVTSEERGNIYNFSGNYDVIDNSEILNIHKY